MPYYEAFVYSYGGEYCSFHGHNTMRLHENPLRATLFSSPSVAKGFDLRDGVWLDGVKVAGERLKLTRLTARVISEERV